MTTRLVAGVGLLLLLFMTLACAVTAFSARQQVMALEGSELYSPDAISVDGNAATLLRDALAAGIDIRIFANLTQDGHTRALVTNDASPLRFPVHDGRSIETRDKRVAMVGSRIRVESRDGRRWFDYDGTSYEVVGRLGLRSDSLLQDDVVLWGEPLFAQKNEQRLVVDGAGVSEWFVDAFGSKDTFDPPAGVNKRTNVDFVSPLVVAFGYVMAGVGIVTTALVASHLDRSRRSLLHVLGRSRVTIYGHPAATFAVMLVVAAVLPLHLVASPVAAICERASPFAVVVAEGVAGMLVFSLAMTVPRTRRRGLSWS